MSDESVTTRLRRHAEHMPDKVAVRKCRAGRFPGDRSVTFGRLHRDVEALAAGFKAAGLRPGDKTLFMVRPGLDFFTGFFALLRLGAPPVLIDPGMGRARLFECVRDCEPVALAGIPAAHLATRLWPRWFRSIRTRIAVGGFAGRLLGGRGWRSLLAKGYRALEADPSGVPEPDPGHLAAILFTTGSTGPAKGVEYTHAMLARQVKLLADALAVRDDDADCATYPGFSLYSVALGMTATIPDMDPTRPGFVDPDHILAVANGYRCTFMFGSPALWRRVTAHAMATGAAMPTVRTAVMAGAPAPEAVHERLLGGILPPGAETYSPYGATEAMPVALLAGSEALAETYAATRLGKGTCVGKPVPGVAAAVIGLTDDPVEAWSESLRLPTGMIGEIVVAGEHVTRHYHQRPDADRLAKIPDAATGRVWHRMGDAGYFDDRGRLWFCGRKAHRVDTPEGVRCYSVCCEAILNQHPAVERCALVRCRAEGDSGEGVPEQGKGVPGLAVELKADAKPSEALRAELLAHAHRHELTRPIRHILFYPGMLPTDIRHNAKLNRERLTEWANAKGNSQFTIHNSQ